MSRELSIGVRRLPANEGRVVRMRLEASDGAYAGVVEIWCPAERVAALGRGLADFSGKPTETFEFHHEEQMETQNLVVRAIPGRTGRTALELKLAAGDAECRLRHGVEVTAINRLGYLLADLSIGANGGFRWTPRESHMLPASDDLS
jgi:hypothetical protein